MQIIVIVKTKPNNIMNKYVYFLTSIILVASCCKENNCPNGNNCDDIKNTDLSGIYNASFDGYYSNNSSTYDWERDQLMKISKINDTLYDMCVFYGDSCISGTNTKLKLSSSFLLEGTFFYQKANAMDWQEDTLSGYFKIENNTFSGMFTAETIIELPPNEGGYLLLPVQGTFLFTKSN
jgi:hypothetical protein